MLVNNAGVELFGPLLEADCAAFERQHAVNVTGVLRMCQLVARSAVARQQRATLVNVGSVQGALAVPWSGAYAASKFAVHALSDALRIELRPLGVRVLCVAPGATQSALGRTGAAFSALDAPRPATDPYAPCRSDIRARALGDHGKRTPASAVAQHIVDQVLAAGAPPAYSWVAKYSFIMPFLAFYV